jgi:hypothetical protein
MARHIHSNWAVCRCGETQPRFMIKLLAAWTAMGFRRPKIAW